VAVGDSIDLTSRFLKADYLIICPPDFVDTAGKLARYRERQGMVSMVVDLQSIMDSFNHGIHDPRAIRSFLAYARAHWRTAPRYVVLAGHGSFDYRDVQGVGDNLIPAMLVATPDGLFSSDNWYADVEGDDGVPEIAIGRLPAQTSDELSTMIRRIKAYESADDDKWRKRVVLIADDEDDGGDFEAASEQVARLVPDDYERIRLYLSETSTDEIRTTLFGTDHCDGLLDDGVFLLNYLGHGTLDRIGDEGILMSSDLPGLTNANRLPIVFGMTCLLGHYSVPGLNCMATDLLRQPQGGAIATFAASGLSINYAAKDLNEYLFRSVFDVDGDVRLGDAVQRALRLYRDNGGAIYLTQIYALMGDPALKLRADD
jgi:hypothetical protein